MKCNHKFAHIALLFIEFFVLIALALIALCFGSGDSDYIYRQYGCTPILLMAVGGAVLLIILFLRKMLFFSSLQIVIISIVGLFFLVLGMCMHEPSRPIYKLFGRALTAQERMARFHAVKVVFDSAGGYCCENIRIVKYGKQYGGAMNLYPSEDIRYFTFVRGVSLNPCLGVFHLEADNQKGMMPFVNYFSTNCIISDVMSGKLTYVVEVLSLSGKIKKWVIGSTPTGEVKEYAQLSQGSVGVGIDEPCLQFITLTGGDMREDASLLDRAYMHLDNGVKVEGFFRVSLFAGTGVSHENYRYVVPGEVIQCPLPTPVRSGYKFEGWYDGNQLITNESTVNRQDVVLKAHWRKL